MIQLSEHLNLSEMVHPEDGLPSPTIVENLIRFARNVFEPLRAKAVVAGLTSEERGLLVDSGWRSEAHNHDVGGVPTSQHLPGNAADIFAPSLEDPDGERQIELGALASRVPSVGGIGFYHSESCLHVDDRARIGGKITTWYEDETGAYQSPVPDWIRGTLVAFGAVDLL